MTKTKKEKKPLSYEKMPKYLQDSLDAIISAFRHIVNNELGSINKKVEGWEFTALTFTIASDLSIMLIGGLSKMTFCEKKEFIKLLDFWYEDIKSEVIKNFKK